jgi:CDP-diacylglycerol--glycerol-3-phosphate 3-phosphatidyltransferase
VSLPPAAPSTWNIANALTALRVLLVPGFAWLLLRENGQDEASRLAAAAVFALAVLTDRLDGELARRRGLITDVGKIADPIADKLLAGTALVGLALLGELPWWVTVVILVREVAVTLVRLLVIRRGVMPAGRGGKAKTATQSLAILLLVSGLGGVWRDIGLAVMAVALVLTVVSGVDYLAKAYRLRAGPPGPAAAEPAPLPDGRGESS